MRGTGPCLPCLIKRAVVVLLLGLAATACFAQTASLDSVKQLYDQKNWGEIVRIVPPSAENSAQLDLYRGLALAQLQQWSQARAAFESGERKEPAEERFSVELAGVAYRENDLAEAKRQLHRALTLNPDDSYALNFLGTIYLLEGNLEAALEYWNRIESPHIAQIQEIPQPRLDAALLDRAFAVPPLSVMRLQDFETTDARIAALGVFPVRRWELQPAGQDDYNLVLHAVEENGWGANKWVAALSALEGLPYETVYPEYHNARGEAVNFDSLVRWDSQKRRLYLAVSLPPEHDPKWNFRAYVDGRDEKWDLTNSLFGATTAVTAMKLRRVEASVEFRRIQSGRWSWQTKGAFSRRTFGDIVGVPAAATSLFSSGDAIEWDAETDYRLLSMADRRITLDSSGTGGVARNFAPQGAGGIFGRAEGSLRFHWFPRATGDDYEMTSQWRAGMLAGAVPFDEFYTLGVERDDNNRWLRGISGTRGGEKGNSPMGRRYLLWNWEWQKVIYHDAYFEFRAGPVFDSGNIADPSGAFGSRGWLWDPGAELTVRVLDTVNVVLSYGHDMRSGQNTFFATGVR